MSADPRESQEWAEYGRLRDRLDPHVAMTRPAYLAWSALDAFVLRLLERREPVTLRGNTLEQLQGIAAIPTAGPIVTVRLTPPEARSILRALNPVEP